VKGIILAGGKGTRLYPLTTGVNKQLLPIYDKPLIYYPLSLLMLAEIREVLIISDDISQPLYRRLLGGGDKWGMNFSYLVQDEPRGIAEALILGKDFLEKQPVCLVLGDNILYGTGIPNRLRRSAVLTEGARIFAYQVKDPRRYGIVKFDYVSEETGQATAIQEKPVSPLSDYAVPGVYFYDHRAVEFAEKLEPSDRGELEITDVNRMYLNQKLLEVEVLGRGVAWLDAGTHEARMQASTFVQVIQQRQGLMIACPEEIAFRQGYIGEAQLRTLALQYNNSYGTYLMDLLR